MNDNPSLPDLKAKKIFSAAREILNSIDRAKYLDRACAGDQKLRANIDGLLLSSGNSTLGGVKLSNTSPKPFELKAGTMIEEYMVVEEILPRGGCGVVYRAEQQKPIKRRVAIKLVGHGMDVEAVLTRFNNERQTLANLNDPGIVNIFDAGSFRECPYFVMEYIQGQSITEYADSHRLTIQERLEMFLDVCEAVQYAHDKGIIHRDIKPQNILVAERNGKQWPKVIDFGIAKALNDDSGATQTGQLIGTPAYMSPEQTGSRALSIDNRTDIYSLGVVLYELLVGRLPFAPKKPSRRWIRGKKPLRPVAVFKELGEHERLNIAQARQVEPSSLEELLRADLDCIVMKCLERNRRRRFKTVGGLATDIQNYLKGEKLPTPPLPKPESNVGRRTFIAVMIFSALMAVSIIAYKVINSPPPETPEELFLMMTSPTIYEKNIEAVHAHQTQMGGLVWDWLVQQPWFKEKGIGKIEERRNNGLRKELVVVYDSVAGIEKFSVVFFEEGGILKFHDIYIYEMMGDSYDMYLSYILKNRKLAQAEFDRKNPNKNKGNLFSASKP